MNYYSLHTLLFIMFICFSCTNETVEQYAPTPLALKTPKLFSENIIAPVIPSNNPQTVEGVRLGKKLFFDPILSGNNTKLVPVATPQKMHLQIPQGLAMVSMAVWV